MSENETMRERRRRVLGRLFTRAAQAFQRRATEQIQAAGFDDYRLGDNALLIHLESDGTRISDLAERAGMTKQGMSQLVVDLQKRGYVTKKPDPTDGRAQLVVFTDRGEALLEAGVATVEALDAEVGELLGERAEVIREGLAELLESWDSSGF